MSDVIKLLPDSVANQIAAGEVIQRPASVIKELVENAVDAGATSIEIILKDAGRTLIQVIDNGQGMTATDARLAFERHSTSKISKAEDLFSLHTMGFRGEALASIAAISQVELHTAREGEQIGTKLLITASKCESQEADVCPSGSNFMIKNIFFNVPARRKFLKSNQVELSNIVKEFEKLALVNHTIDFEMVHNGNTMYQMRGGTFKQRIIDLFGRTLEPQLIPLTLDTSLARIDGFICRPENARKRNFIQYLFVNGRYMRHPYFHKAIISSYGQLIPDNEQPNYFLNFSVDPESIDVNIHPTKTEIKFENEMPIWQVLSAAVKESLGRFSAVPSIDFDTQDAPEIPVMHKGDRQITEPSVQIDPTYNPFTAGKKQKSQQSSPGYSRPSVPSATTDWEKLYANFERSKQESIDSADNEDSKDGVQKQSDGPTGTQSSEETLMDASSSTLCTQIKGRYILSPIKSGLMIVDQHRAHVRILYDRYFKQISSGNIASQTVMFPVVLHLSAAQCAIFSELESDLTNIGFSLARLSGNDWSVNAVPSIVENKDINDLIQQIIESVENGGESPSDKILERIAMSVSQVAAIPYGRNLTQAEMDVLLSDLLSLPQPKYTPDGKLVISIIPIEQINKMF
jgi:DNA mismatch repair protein MutL